METKLINQRVVDQIKFSNIYTSNKSDIPYFKYNIYEHSDENSRQVKLQIPKLRNMCRTYGKQGQNTGERGRTWQIWIERVGRFQRLMGRMMRFA